MEYTKYLNQKKAKLVLLEHTECTDKVITDCTSHEILKDLDILLLNNVEDTDQVGRNCLFWMTIQKKTDCWEKLIEIFNDNGQRQVIELLSKGTRNDNTETLLTIINKKGKLDVKVKKPRYDQGYITSSKDGYSLDPKNIGLALIINITKFETKKPRYGAEQDSKYLTNLWKQMGYKVYSHEGIFTLARISEIVEDFLNIFRKKRTPGSCVVFLGSHGSEGNIEMSKGPSMNLKGFLEKFSEEPVLRRKPKLFFIQACRNFPMGTANEADVPSGMQHTLVCFSTRAGKPSYLQTALGSYFVYHLTQVLMDQTSNKGIQELIVEVSGKMNDEQKNAGIQEKDRQLCYPLYKLLKPFHFNLRDTYRNNSSS